MKTFRISKKSILIAIAVFITAYLYNNSKIPQDLQKTDKAHETIEESAIPEAYEGVKQEMKLTELGEEQKILSFDMTGYAKDGRKKWDIKGESADIVSEIIILNNIEAKAYSEDRTVTLKAKGGRYDREDNSIRLEDDVVVTTSDGVSLKAEWFKWNSETDRIESDSFVEVQKDNLYASGYGALASTKEKEVQLNNGIVVKQDDMTINCGGPLIIDYNNNKASFYDKVEVTESRGALTADSLDIFFDPDSKKIDVVLAEGNVRLKRGQNVAKGQKITYTVASGEAVLTGNPEVVIYSGKDLGDAFTGD